MDIQSGLAGAWALMWGRVDGLKRLDLTADGFWDSFAAIPIALPALMLSWVAVTDTVDTADAAERLGIMLRFALVDLGSWILPLIGFALVARRLGIADRFVHYVVASNWGNVIAVWLITPAALLQILAPDDGQFDDFVSIVLYLASIALTWRLTTTALGKGPGVGSAVFAGMFGLSIATFAVLQALLGLTSAG